MSDDAKHQGQGQTFAPGSTGHNAASDDVTAQNTGSPDAGAGAATGANASGQAGAETGAHGSGGGDAALAGQLGARVKELEAQQADLTDRLLRAHAEMDNLRKRTEKEKSESLKYAVTKFAHDIVGVSDNFQRAVEAVPHHIVEHDATLKALVEGVVMTERAFQQVLERHGVKRMDPAGQQFDPNLHQAVMEQQDPSVASGTVLQVFQVGYTIQDRVLRPAMVSVARGGSKATRPESGQQGAGQRQAANENAAEQSSSVHGTNGTTGDDRNV